MDSKRCAITINDDEFGNVVIMVDESDFDLAIQYYKKHYPKWKKECTGTVNHVWNYLDKVNEILDNDVEIITGTFFCKY